MTSIEGRRLTSLDTHHLSIPEDVDIDKISLVNQLRKDSNYYITELIDSIRKVGLLHPIVVRVNGNEHFQAVCGCRRYTACKALRWKKIPCFVIEANDREAFEISLIENMHRCSLEPIEEANAFKKYVLDLGWGGISELASKLGRSHSYIIKRIMLLDLPQDIIDFINNRQLTPSAAEELFPIKDESKQSELAKLIVDRQLSSKEAREVLRSTKNQSGNYYCSQIPDSNYDYDYHTTHHNGHQDEVRAIDRSLCKSILALRIAMSRIVGIIDEYEDNWFVYECLMEEKNVLHRQIDILFKKKKKLIKMMHKRKLF
ncbi:MAG: ParB/RepB/Spo0J family partition protein [Nitrososphaeraceae archaeon]